MRFSLIVAILFLFSSCATLKQDALERPNRVIDAHVHVRFADQDTDQSGFIPTREEFLRQLKAVNGVGAIAHSPEKGAIAVDFASLNVTPCLGMTKDPDISVLERAVRQGPYRCFKIYLGYQYQYAYHPKYKAVYRLAEKLGVPVVFHTGDTYDVDGQLKYADPLSIDEVAVEFRKVKFVIAHLGNPWIQSAAEVAYKNANVYLDVSALLVADLKGKSPEQLKTYVTEPIRWAWGYVENPKKMMFGSDWPLTSIPDYLDAVKDAIPREHWDRFFYQNAVEVFGLDQSPRSWASEKKIP